MLLLLLYIRQGEFVWERKQKHILKQVYKKRKIN